MSINYKPAELLFRKVQLCRLATKVAISTFFSEICFFGDKSLMYYSLPIGSLKTFQNWPDPSLIGAWKSWYAAEQIDTDYLHCDNMWL